MQRKTLLYIVQDFPPVGGGGVMRVVKFCKYLPDFGWDPVVLTLKEQYNLPHLVDRSLLNELSPALPVYRTDALKPTGSRRVEMVRSATPGRSGLRARALRGFRTTRRALGQRYGVAQDEGYLWLPYARREIDRILVERHVDAVLTSSPPHAVHWLGAYASMRGGLPWLADFRDGWTDDLLFRSRSSLRNRLERWQESQIILLADRVTVAADKLHEWFLNAHGDAYAAKGAMITNGFDAADFAGLAASDLPPGRGATLTLAHVGGVGGTRRPIRPLIQALQSLDSCGVPRGAFTLQLVGTVANEDLELARSVPGVRVEPHLPHAEALDRMVRADVLVLIQGRMSADAHSGKLFEYVAARRPILTLTYPGQLAEFVLREGWGWVAQPEDVGAIQSALLHIYTLWKEGRLAAQQPSLASQTRFERRRLTAQLAAVLDGMTGPQQATSGAAA